MDISQIIPQFGGAAFTILAFVVALSIIVAIHEYGHYIVGRWSGIDAEVFSLGFGPVLYSRVDKRGTKWQIAALPFGGYVKFLGDANAASVGANADIREMDKRRTMLGAPLWARAATVAAGPFFNFALSFLIFALVILSEGQARDPLTVSELRALPADYVQELEPGDEVLAIDGRPAPSLEEFDDFLDTLPLEATLEYRVRRDGEERVVQGPYPYPPVILGLNPQSAAMDVDLAVGDVILSINGTDIRTFEELRQIVGASDGGPLALEVWRDGEVLDFTLVPRSVDLPRPEGGFETRYLIGISGGLFFEAETESLGLLASLGYGAAQVWFIITSSLDGLWHMITGAISTCNLSGPVGIAETSGAMASQGPLDFIWFVAVLSTAVGMLNLFPVPILDGGHLVFHAYEAVRGKPPSDAALRVLMAAGLSVLLTLMLFALANDLFLCP
ncbi:Putative membrane-associated zinc metalloprotease [Oceanicola granulosus HTCC2516]|uniref:Zinc metalloprotease n=1 Tax=Oceanicola granulosus (strain ATCC BAA-861 / DSM 15982 / KCTC 12143 / HTCC2516) TaxID=314256 RepID=Q2CHX7_OCEGH|nr:RIP metalloprotease RseP [Oceanicola granulosus]EAR52167.1 Putative membrane-associated zinc metalloprotease [Oceanicola granulosus HTCC2516]